MERCLRRLWVLVITLACLSLVVASGVFAGSMCPCTHCGSDKCNCAPATCTCGCTSCPPYRSGGKCNETPACKGVRRSCDCRGDSCNCPVHCANEASLCGHSTTTKKCTCGCQAAANLCDSTAQLRMVLLPELAVDERQTELLVAESVTTRNRLSLLPAAGLLADGGH